ncbi:hypothetical protein N7474_005380 [Penicillium riverlandense]|uniref:uncharacterized protein n=1 Tax=Penicillium riverlandense TaxID=1903569 RepID=UPI002547ABBA|nr:uncharacterized protein N7474_005380 [Penicillium riverlandense]KAJ5819789.1 hypothetical protein N7474_005380 [Penicillium riverlandense]
MGSNAGMTLDQIQLIKATVPVLEQHGGTITTVFYDNLLKAHPELNNVFNTANQVNGHQPRSLAGALYAYASHIDDLGALSPAVELICNKHASLYIRPDDYKIVGKYLLEAMSQVLGTALTPEIHAAWAAAYWQLADIMIGRENQIYQQSEGWTDWRQFKIADKIRESDEITSFYLSPIDGKPLPPFQPGQYISVKLDIPALKYAQCRQYSLSDKPCPDYYRISVKKEQGLNAAEPGSTAYPGYVSNILHDTFKKGDTIDVSHPCGDFFLSSTKPEMSHPVVLISAGVGLTPLTSMMNTLTTQSPSSQRHIHFIHGARTSGVRAFKDHIYSLMKEHPNLQTSFFISQPSVEDKQGVDYHHIGRVDLAKMDSNKDLFIDNPHTEYYICGPDKFMTDIEASLKAQGVSTDRIKMELFGTGGVTR